MKFSELTKGDWFTTVEHSKNIFIKATSTIAFALGNSSDGCTSLEFQHPYDKEVIFCPHFCLNANKIDEVWHYNEHPNILNFTNKFKDIPIGAIYKEDAIFCKKLSDTVSIIIYHANFYSMGNILSHTMYDNGDFYPCISFNFAYPEVEQII